MVTAEPDTPTIFSRAGGEPAFARWPHAFYDLVEADELLSGLFGGRVTAEHREAVTAWWSEVMGGPASYTADHGGYEHMLASTAAWRSRPSSDCASSPC